ncbi:unnamed protein product [Pleuronectes platessa]|uniref:Uncharacterized protein n=1 Tax=Pleuronectes platessa TaxID=8262 RepID=A0A9N7UYC3_PLEPL|nr:unnamed protein product [Pleuronectes platessa]
MFGRKYVFKLGLWSVDRLSPAYTTTSQSPGGVLVVSTGGVPVVYRECNGGPPVLSQLSPTKTKRRNAPELRASNFLTDEHCHRNPLLTFPARRENIALSIFHGSALHVIGGGGAAVTWVSHDAFTNCR